MTEPGNPAPPARAAELKRFLRFVAVGVLNTAFGYGVFALAWWLTRNQDLSVVVATMVGVVFNYFTTARLVFASRGFGALLPFIAGYAVVMLVNIALLRVLTGLGLHALAGQLICLPVSVVLAYAINAFVVFRKPVPK